MRTSIALLFLVAGSLAAAATPAAPASAAAYPLTTCIVSGEALDSMGGPIAKVVNGQEVKFCCKGCVKAFDKDPAKFLAKLAAPATGAAPASGPHQH